MLGRKFLSSIIYFIHSSLLKIYLILRKHLFSANNIWEGIFEKYEQVLCKGEGFNSKNWINLSRNSTMSVIKRSKKYKTIPLGVTEEHTLLPLLISILSKQKKSIEILDFGGGCGSEYINLINSLTNPPEISYYIVESSEICKIGSEIFKEDKNIHFFDSLPKNLNKIDIIYIDSVLQYIEAYEKLLVGLCLLNARYFFFVKLSAGDIPTYTTAQLNVPGSIIPYWFLNVNEIIAIMKRNGYVLIYKSANEYKVEQSNFPKTHRIEKTCNLLFRKDF